jgi:hypothetical protein
VRTLLANRRRRCFHLSAKRAERFLLASREVAPARPEPASVLRAWDAIVRQRLVTRAGWAYPSNTSATRPSLASPACP